MKRITSPPSAKEAVPPSAFDVVFAMEHDVRAAADLSIGIVMLMSGFGKSALETEEQIGAVLRVAYDLRARVMDVLESWEKAFEASKGGAA